MPDICRYLPSIKIIKPIENRYFEFLTAPGSGAGGAAGAPGAGAPCMPCGGCMMPGMPGCMMPGAWNIPRSSKHLILYLYDICL